ncbi:IclR family transcriptional regulator [Natrinema sp. 1APR25-10V2]|uniref:IclR family transcriptional regulator n=1 Tax=Natrinema sp. 1APR25-10V2 TaxID=2951081 RepID=UPI002875B4E8|nr:IclR family transcriptional regulator [Natrinema sp. 1APR25-10V2]MDS0475226.1 IclR family transcriptional regulator [Natrinema sp. 1APR25-10V2]
MAQNDVGNEDPGPRSPTIKSVETSLEIVDELQARNGARVSELAEAIGKSKGTIHKHLITLLKHDYVVKAGDEYRIGLRFLDVGGYALHQVEGLQYIEPKIRELADLTGETVQFSVEQRGRCVVLERKAGQKGVFSRARIGRRFYMHQVAGGKVILANLPDERVREIVARHGLPAATDETITSEAELFEELETVRERGHAFNIDESTQGLHAVAVPLMGPDGDIFGAFAVAGPSHRMRGERFKTEIPDMIRSVVNELELNLAHS